MQRERLDPADPSLLVDFQKMLRFDKNALDDALLEQADTFHRVSEGFSYALSRRDQKKAIYEETLAEIALKERRSAADAAEKITEDGLKARVTINKDVVRAKQDHEASNLLLSRWQGLKESWQQRSYVLKDMVALYSAGYFADAVGGGQRRKVEDERYKGNREALAAERERQEK